MIVRTGGVCFAPRTRQSVFLQVGHSRVDDLQHSIYHPFFLWRLLFIDGLDHREKIARFYRA
ncbi:hypothetical protein D3C77_593840 [compost metagenome]